MERLDTILLRGAIGVGKSTVLLEIGEILEDRDEAYALVDLDWLAWVRPPADSPIGVRQILAANLAHACRVFRGAGVRRLAMARAVEAPEDIAQIRAALGTPARLTVVCLTAAPDEVARRLLARDTGARLAEHLRESERFAGAIDGAERAEIAIATDQREAASVAREVLLRAGWSAG